MSWLAEHWVQLVFILVYLAIIARHGWIGARHSKTIEDYLVAGRGLGGWVIALSFYATFMSTNTFLGAAGKSWDVGLVWCIGGLVLSGFCCVSWFVVAPRFVPLTKEYNSLTVADFLGHHYNSPALRRWAAAVVFLASVLYLVAIFRGSALTLQSVLSLPAEISGVSSYVWAVAVVFIVVTSYTLLGGFESVVLTDALQGVLMIGGAVGIAAAVQHHGGGLNSILQNLRSQDPAFVSWHGKMSLLTILGLNLSVAIKYIVEPRQLSRFYGLKDKSAQRVASMVAPTLVIVTYLCLLPIGAFAHALIPADAIKSSDEVIPYLLGTTHLFGPVLSSIFLLVLLSAAMSSIDSVLLVAASTIDRDLIQRPGETKSIKSARVWVVIVSLISSFVAISPLNKDIVEMTAFSGSLYGACFFPALVVGLFWRGASARAAIVSLVLGAVATITWFVAKRYGLTSLHEVYVGMSVSLLAYIGIAMSRWK